MATHVRKAPSRHAKGTTHREIRAELRALDTAFKRVSKTPQAAIHFLAKAGIVNKKGKLAEAYR